ncbi:MAG: hypothetical protein LUD83_07195 [Clostridiales bacterium]|nr:hypothetical protein [Clostridiales bacterium]
MQEKYSDTVTPGISFSKKRGEILVFRSTIQAPAELEYIRFLMNMGKGCLAVQACDKKTLGCFKVPEYDPKDWAFRIYSDVMNRMLWKRCGRSSDFTYRVSGIYYPEHHIVEFDLAAAERVTDAVGDSTGECELERMI